MRKLKQFMFSPKGTLVAFGAAIALLLFSSIGGARAALTHYSENHMTLIGTKKIDVALMENDQVVEDGVLLKNLLAEKDADGKDITGKLKIGKKYDEKLAVKNTGLIDQYVRVTVYKRWVNANGDPVPDVDPGYIELTLEPTPVNAGLWEEDTDPSTKTLERSVFYYKKPLGVGETTEPFITNIKINGDIGDIVTAESNKLTFDYQGLTFQVVVDVDAVQTHNAADAILSSWGREVVDNSVEGSKGVLDNLEFIK